ncbi:phage head closure protein [Pseudomonas fulva]|jgi:SPP1 family predicted phage head-tail adaptor|uniref:phage head closure protein n=1 Tax=Pseudomonas fulva TaxID=47880 RepID=UPI000F771F09|nr:phage head closure protein [Pseudomonas fulva]MBA1209375.1 phage head closure protein [Pseudomonas fulva]MBA1217763.1 phage head closure protein [Pseudomonas fulva]MDH0573243.1 phage head closure protein [Pseudomonas fulva]RRW56908.1 head-tail adaptor protein [Pseudomonas fulva]
MRAGPLRHRCQLQEEKSTPEPGGGRRKSWVAIKPIWAEIQLPTGRVDPVANQIQNVVSAEIRVRFSRIYKNGMRLVHVSAGDTYLIEAVLPSNERDMLRLLCSNVINP